MKKSLEVLLRKNRGKAMLPSYEALFIECGFKKESLSHIDLDTSDEIIQKIRTLIPKFENDNELLSDKVWNFQASKLLKEVYDGYEKQNCYIYTDAYDYCGMYDVCVGLAFQFAFNIALRDIQHTCFLVDKNFNYTFTINYYDSNHNDDPNTFDIQRMKVRSNVEN